MVPSNFWGLDMGRPRHRTLLTLGAVLLVLGASFGVLSTAFFGGIIPGFKYGGWD
jgi:hypothetical protein